ncbi:MAG: PQQ-binding-like beta-propeller repeat protein, partial [Gemmatimonadota bacterium]|nr:PQQ-binding-like beta-propeller repeat protein [Gemmatimonadota bacterium]
MRLHTQAFIVVATALMVCLIFSCLQSTIRAAEAGAGRWSIFRGNQNLTGVASGSLPDSLKLLWTFTADDAIVSSAAISDGRVYVGSTGGKLYALSLETGEKIWDFDTGNVVEASPLLLDGTVYVGSMEGTLFA